MPVEQPPEHQRAGAGRAEQRRGAAPRAEAVEREAEERREEELNRSVITIPNEPYQAEYGKILQRISCGLKDCEVCEAEARREAEKLVGAGYVGPLKLGQPMLDENRRPIPATLEELISNG